MNGHEAEAFGESRFDAFNPFFRVEEPHGEPYAVSPYPGDSAGLLADAFTEFIATSSRLEASYRELQGEVVALGHELAERNAALKASVSQNDLMRLALRQIVDSMPCGVVVIDRGGKISTINPESGRLLGIDAAAFEQKPPSSLKEITKRCGVRLEWPVQPAADTDVEHELRLTQDGEQRWLHVRRRALTQTVTGAAPQTILILRDVTTQKRAERDREAGRNALALAQITTMLAHEIRNPLASLELFAELTEQDEEHRSEWISNLRAGIRSLSGTVNNVLSFHAVNSLKVVPMDIQLVISNALQFIQPLARQAGILLQASQNVPETLVNGNSGALLQVLLNLLTNAIRHTPSGGTVTLSSLQMAGDQGNIVIVECADSGCGLAADQIAHVFEPGFSGSGDSSGLGLAVCERIITQHHGRITAKNRECGGAVFSMELPAVSVEDWIA